MNEKLEHLNYYIGYKDIAIIFDMGTTKASLLKSKVASSKDNLCPYSSRLVKRDSVFKELNIDYLNFRKDLVERSGGENND